MTIRQLYVFKTVCEEESITKAAEKLSMAQPAVSRTISELEEMFGTQIFDRHSRKVYLNSAGNLFLSKVVPLLDLYEDLERCSKELGKQSALRIGATETISSSILPSILSQFKNETETAPTTIYTDTSDTIEDMLVHHQLDLGLVEGVVSSDQLERIAFSDFPLSIVCAPNYVFQTELEGIPSADFLSKEPWLLMEKNSPVRESFDGAMMFHNLSITPFWTSSSPSALKAAAKQGLGLTILPRILMEEELAGGELIELHTESFSLALPNHLVFHKDKFQSLSFQTFINLVMFHM